MTVQECYQQIQGNYENVLKRLKTDERIVKFLELFLSDTTYEKLSEAGERLQLPHGGRIGAANC